MSKTEIVLSELIKSSLFGVSPNFPDDVDWSEVLKEAEAQTVVSLVSRAVPKEFRGAWEVRAAQSDAHFMRALYEQTQIAMLFDNAKIPFVVIKGASAAVYYPRPSSRTMGDVDVLVGDGKFDAAFELLKENGYEFLTDYEDGRDYSFKKGGVIFELHKKYSDKQNDIEIYLADGIKNAVTLELYGKTFPSLPKAENGLVLLDHIRHHLFGGLGIRQIIDFMLFVNSIPDENEFERDFLPLFERANLGTLAKVITKMCKKHFGLPVSAAWCEDADDATCDELLGRVFSSGNFGRKDPYEYSPVESLTMEIKKFGFFRALQNAGVENCAAFKKHKILRPFAWIYQLFRYLFRGVAALFRGKLRAKDVKSGSEKSDFYKRLGIQ